MAAPGCEPVLAPPVATRFPGAAVGTCSCALAIAAQNPALAARASLRRPVGMRIARQAHATHVEGSVMRAEVIDEFSDRACGC